MASSKKYTRQISEFIDTLPKNIIPINIYESCCNGILKFNRYWWDPINSRIIMKPKRGKRFKIVKPMIDNQKTRFVWLLDVNDFKVWVNYDYLIKQTINKQYIDKYSYALKQKH